MSKNYLRIAAFIPLFAASVSATAIEAVDGVYQIGTPQELTEFASLVNGGEASINAVLTADIDMGGAEWECPISGVSPVIGGAKYYHGTFDGQGHTISNLTIKGKDNSVNCGGLFGLGSASAVMKNLIVRDCDFTALYSIGGIAGEWYGMMENCASINVQISGSNPHGLIGYGGTLKNSYTTYANTSTAGSTTVVNCFAAESVNEEAYASGRLCYLLNKGMETPVWLQTIGSDKYPVLAATHHFVLEVDGKYISYPKDSYVSEMTNLANIARDEILEMGGKANQALVDAYKASVEAFATAGGWAAVVTGYYQMQERRKEVQANVNAYAAYETEVKNIKDNLPAGLSGDTYNLLKNYLSDTDEFEPSEALPNGSYLYIISHKPLDTAGINAEIEFAKKLSERAQAEANTPGADMTALLNNADFRASSIGWDGEMTVGYVPSLPVVECYNNTGERYQTITGLKNGLYEFTLNAWFRPGGNNNSRMYSTYIFANAQVVPVMSIQEDPIAFEDAVNMQNCYIENPGTYPYDLVYNENYFIPNSFTGAAYAFKGNRFLNRILVSVTDGTLRVGIRTLGTGKGADCTEFANAKLYYWGNMNEAGDGLTRVLACQVARAKALLETPADADLVQPNFSAALREKLASLVSKAEAAADEQSKYDAIKALSPVFEEVLDGQKAYVYMMNEVKKAQSGLTNDVYGKLDTEAYEQALNMISNVYANGTYTSEEAWGYTSPVRHNMKVENDYYLITNADDLAWFARLVADGNSSINGRLMADIDMAGAVWKCPISGVSDVIGGARYFHGTFDGQGHTISNLTINGKESSVSCGGLFGLASASAVIRDLIVRDCTFSALYSIGGIGGEWYGVMENCASINVEISGSNPHGLIGYGGTISNSYSTYKDVCTAGATTITNCYGADDLDATDFASGRLCFLLNGSSTIAPVWHQSIGTDEYPTLDTAHGIVNQIGATGYATQYIPGSAVQIPSGVSVFTGSIDTPWIALNPLSGIIPAGEAVVLQGAEGYYSFVPTIATSALGNNELKGTAEPLTATGAEYVLAEKDGVVGFYQAEGTIPAGKAYIEYAGAGVKGFFFGDATGLTQTLSQGEGEPATVYDLSGRRVERVQKGMYIINGKKVIK